MKVFYSPEMSADSGSFSPSSGKPKLIVEDWLRRGLGITIVPPTPVSAKELMRVHDRKYVEGVLDCSVNNGFGNKFESIAASLPYTTGSLLCAAREAVREGSITCSPTSGFHHAGFARGGGFCTFNGLVVAATALRHEGRVARVGILDFDMHYGDGTASLVQGMGWRNRPWITHFTAGRWYRERSQAKAFFRQLPSILAEMRKCDVVLYQAGADPHVNDPLGGWLTTKEMRRRDEIVFSGLDGTPVAWCLAGGYQKMEVILEIHRNTAMAAMASQRDFEHPARYGAS